MKLTLTIVIMFVLFVSAFACGIKIEQKVYTPNFIAEAPFKKVGLKQESKVQRAVAISGCVILKDDGKRVTYLQKCDNCNKKGSEHSLTLYPGGRYTTSFKCSKCKTKNKVEIIRKK